jgi:RecA/RadA recombinase
MDSKRRGNIIPLGLSRFDSELKGGLSGGELLQIYGVSGTGKTQLALQLLINALQQSSEAIAGFVDSSGGFRPERLTEIAALRELDDKSILERIYVWRSRSVQEQIEAVASARTLMRRQNFSILVIDSVTENFIDEYAGEKHVIARQLALARHLRSILELALDQNLPVAATNMVRGRIDRQDVREAAGGLVDESVHHSILMTKHERSRAAYLTHAWSLEEIPVNFRITSRGVEED